MARKMPVQIQEDEEIIAYTHNIGHSVQLLVGTGKTVNGVFEPTPSQTYRTYEISEEEYNALMMPDEVKKKPQGEFRKDDLWSHVDAIRNK